MIHTINNTQKKSFMKSNGSEPDMYKKGEDGLPISVGKYKGNTIPGTFVIKKIKWDVTKRSYDINIPLDELNEIVNAIRFFDKSGNKIEKANPRNERDPFFLHDDLFFKIENGSNSLDDDVPLNRLQLAWMKSSSSPEFHIQGDKDNPAMRALKNYTVSTPALDNAAASTETDNTIEAIKLLDSMTYDIQCTILKAMGVPVRDAEPIIVRNTLFRKITEDKNLLAYGTQKKNLPLFLELARTNSSDLNIRGIVTMAKDHGIISKGKDGQYKFGDMPLGRTLNDVQSFLLEKDNFDIVNNITDDLRTKGEHV